MKIFTQQPNFNKPTKPPAFTSNMRETAVTLSGGLLKDVTNRNTTRFFRGDLPWIGLVDHIKTKYQNSGKVNILAQACSDGSEAYSLAMLLISKLGEEAKKFFPIIAKDRDDFFLNTARQGKVPIQIGDLAEIEEKTGKKTHDFLTVDTQPEKIGNEIYYTATMNDELKNAVVFEQGNVLDDMENIKKDNTIFMYRNAWPYFDTDLDKAKEQAANLAQKTAENLGKNSMCIIGNFDDNVNAQEYLTRAGLNQTHLPNCLEKENFQVYFYGNTPLYKKQTAH